MAGGVAAIALVAISGMYLQLLGEQGATAQALEWSLDDGVPEFRFALDKGTYATSFMREIMKAGDLRAY